MIKHTLPQTLRDQLIANPLIEQRLESIIWFGSFRNNQDVHKASDYDIQIIFDKPDYTLTLEINKILRNYPEVDLSIMYLQDIYDHKGNIIFHDGTKSFFFMYVLAAGDILYGRNVYEETIKSLTLEDSKSSLLMTAREYLSRLRVMAAQSPQDTLKFKKYSLKFFKDVLLFKGLVPIKDLTRITNAFACDKIIELYNFSEQSQSALNEVTRYDEPYTSAQLAALLQDYELIIEEICNE